MEKNILYHLIFLCGSINIQSEVLRKLESLPEKSYDNETRVLFKAIKFAHDRNRVADERSINTYLAFSKERFDIDSFFWDVDEKQASKIDLQEAANLFIHEKEIEINKKIFEEALREYEKTGDVEKIRNLDLSNDQSREYITTIEDATRSGLIKLKRIKDKVDTSSVKFSSHFFYMQMILKGLEPGELVIMAARPGVGKTAMSLAMLNDFSKQGKRSLFISLEMTKEELIERMLIAKTGITRATFFSQAGFTDEKYEELEKAAEEINKQAIKIVDNCPSSFTKIREIIREEHRRNGLDVVFIDYLGLIGSFNGEDNLDIKTTISKISRESKLLAMELKIPVILIQQVNRNVAAGSREDSSFKELQVTDLRDSGTLEQDANKVFLLWNQEPQDEKEKQDIVDSKYKIILSIAKNRNGQSNQKVLFEFNRALQRIKEVDWITKPSSWVDHK